MLDQEPETTQREQTLALEILASVAQEIDKGRAFQQTAVGAVTSALARYRKELRTQQLLDRGADLALLSRREQEVVSLLESGLRPAQMALQLHIAQDTVRNHLKHIFRKLNVGSQIELLALLNGGKHG